MTYSRNGGRDIVTIRAHKYQRSYADTAVGHQEAVNREHVHMR
jgi:hypothetical protein